MAEQVKRYAYIDAVRGYAILMVLAVHTSQLFDNLPAPLSMIVAQGARGVQLFFVASALTLCMSWKARHESVGLFYLRRAFRIAPMFWLAIVFYVWRDGIGRTNEFRQIVMTAMFIHGFWPDTIMSVVPGGWSVANEAIFTYCSRFLFPLCWRRVGEQL